MSGLLLAAGCVLACVQSTHAATVPEVLDAGNQWLVAQAASQDRVDDLGEARRGLADEYRTVLREIEGLEAYNRQLERQLRLQGEEIAILDDSISQATTVDRQILPLMLRMVDALEQFVALDIP
ncbi:MAG: DUF3450 family protein, partial [Sinimarinibacterium flocculans]|uniref:DUF3450 family protein n=1 Tax=Sinimarinibacterium flocculans TaxID=985250 RepID=UPI003C6B3D92